MRVLFVCTGNTCRSPMAEALLRKKMPEAEVKSAGVAAIDGDKASENARLVLEQRGITLEHSAQRLTSELMEWADLVLTMTRGHKGLLHNLYPHHVDKIFTLKQYVGWQVDEDVVDPFGGSLDVYARCADELEQLLEMLSKMLTENQSEDNRTNSGQALPDDDGASQ